MRPQLLVRRCGVLAIVIFAGIIFGCKAKPSQEKKAEAIPVRVQKIALTQLQETLDYVGNIKAQDEAIVYPKASGKILEKVKDDGAEVRKGDPIAYIDRDEVGLKFEKSPIESPLEGVVGRLYVDIGQNVSLQTAVALVVSIDTVRINLDIPEKYLPRIALGQNALIFLDAYPQEVFAGQVTKISPVVDLSTRTALIEIAVKNPDHALKSGMFAKVKLVIEEYKDIPVILKEAIVGKNAHVYVYVVENKIARLRQITLGIHQGPYYQVKDG
jgi:membrane fusion protein, multidrug efflux system